MSIIDGAPLGIIALYMSGKIRIVNKMAADIMDVHQDIYRTWGTHIRSYIKDIDALQGHLMQSLEAGGKPFNLEGIRYNDHFLTIRGRQIMNGYILTINNISRIKQIESQSIMSMLEGQGVASSNIATPTKK